MQKKIARIPKFFNEPLIYTRGSVPMSIIKFRLQELIFHFLDSSAKKNVTISRPSIKRINNKIFRQKVTLVILIIFVISWKFVAEISPCSFRKKNKNVKNLVKLEYRIHLIRKIFCLFLMPLILEIRINLTRR